MSTLVIDPASDRGKYCVTASRQASAPGQLVTSASEPAPGRPRPAAAIRRNRSGRSCVFTQRRTRFWWWLVRTLPSPKDCARSASSRSCAPVRFLQRRPIGIEGQARRSRRHDLGQRPLELRPPRLPGHGPDQELHPVPLLVLVVAEAVEQPNDRLGHGQDLAGRNEFGELGPGRAGAASDRHPEATPRRAFVEPESRSEADVVDGRTVKGHLAVSCHVG